MIPALVFAGGAVLFWHERHRSGSYLASVTWAAVCLAMAVASWGLL